MSINWVMLDGQQGFVPLPNERIVHKSSPRIALSITTPGAYPANNPVDIHCNSGVAYLTNQRVVYLPDKATQELQSFSAPILNLHDTHVTFPWFGPNAWLAVLQPVPGGNFPDTQSAIEVKMTFKEGGAPDFHSNFEHIKERLQQVVSLARENNLGRRQDGFLGDVNLDAVNLDQLPSYQDSGRDRMASPDRTTEAQDLLHSPVRETPILAPIPRRPGATSTVRDTGTPADAPPGYEEAQQQSVQAELERRLSQPQP
ncbi:hypothetical protein PV10_01562 [Exophiala mesophila]|uniref:Uncharacterized protein n=1 Tax=Exophiala mesophila TaxID=212818 RepID=A0A0D2AG07_EXOME|nr:uncharacterized protein PV10_01562 [Exophiala mesophila]KIV97858.1 hypothetical protein PV10_01562 [Exophiala mesophila]